jgi:4-hydroxy-4-methyl-2-oxoglutarate aldolase
LRHECRFLKIARAKKMFGLAERAKLLGSGLKGHRMIEEPAVLTISRNMRRPNAAQIAAFQGVPTGFVVDAMMGRGALDVDICPVFESSAVAGPALSVDCGPGDILAALAALHYIRNGDVVVCAFDGYRGCAAAGDRLLGMMKNNGAVGFVTDGPVRDYAGLVGVGLPAWCRGLTPASPVSTGPGRVGFAVQIGGQEVETGDMIVADRDGVVVVPFERIDATIAALVRVTALELELDARVVGGLKIPEAIAALLASDKVAFE